MLVEENLVEKYLQIFASKLYSELKKGEAPEDVIGLLGFHRSCT